MGRPVVPCQLYKTGDGWIYLMCNKEHFWPTLCRLIDREHWIDDARFHTLADRLAMRDELTDMLDDALARQTTMQWMRAFQGKIPAAPVLTPAEALRNPFVTDYRRLQTLTDSNDNAIRVLAQPIKADSPDFDGDSREDRTAPRLGEHTADILKSVGYRDQEIEQLRRDGVIAWGAGSGGR